MKWGLLGGTFDPIHIGHLRSAEEVRELFGLDRVVFIPASVPPHKSDVGITAFSHRERMVRLAIEGNPYFFFSGVENEREGKSYSVETIAHFQNKYGKGLEIYFIVGQDAFQAIKTWKEWERLLKMCHFVVMTRPGYEKKDLQAILPPSFADNFSYRKEDQGFHGPAGYAVYFREVTFLDISSSRIRHLAGQGRSVSYLVPGAVNRYLLEQRLYGRD
ncbi:MAG TPA: nicotinate-nucleotide adenylyltransferase [Syntrophales bacterium]|jgi:nicotinate-nucleotide adenylyltransferase|nr:nicotinate-nucleotide adenylyltransferase [Syntrophales bacterium]